MQAVDELPAAAMAALADTVIEETGDCAIRIEQLQWGESSLLAGIQVAQTGQGLAELVVCRSMGIQRCRTTWGNSFSLSRQSKPTIVAIGVH